MTPNEVREMYGLPPLEEKPKQIVSSAIHRFDEHKCECFSNDSELDSIIQVFSDNGENFDEYEILDKRFMYGDLDEKKVFMSEIKNYNFDILDFEVKAIYRNVLALLEKDPLLPNEEIAKALKVNRKKIDAVMERLIEDGAIEVSEKTSGDQKTEVRKPSKEAKSVLDEQGSSVESLRIMYTYEKRPELKDDLLKTSREFCVKLINQNKIFTRPQIENISKIVGYDVWRYRGGWWTRKGGDVTTPYCRHIWVQNLVRKKNK